LILLFPQLIAIAVLQGVTEFLPISSSGHLILLPHLTDWPDHGLVYDIAAHVGTLIAVVAYFRSDLQNILLHWRKNLGGAPGNEHSRLGWAVLWATIPVGVVGLLTHDFIATHLREPVIIAGTTIGFGVVLWIADRLGARARDTTTLSWSDIALVGLAQSLALIPGTSRSGITISAGLALGLTRSAAARFSFLLSIPVIVLAAGYETWRLIGSVVTVDWAGLIIVVVGAGISAFACIAIFLKTLERVGMLPFVLYRFALGIVLLVLFL
jgi:undecaprenyl-diphosphatase